VEGDRKNLCENLLKEENSSCGFELFYYYESGGGLMKKVLFFLILIVVLKASTGWAITHYVSKTGSDVYPYDSWATAADSIQKGINAASAGDTVRVGAGTYREIVTMIPGIVLLGAGMDMCIIYPYPNSGRDVVYGQDSSIIEGFHIKGLGNGIYNSVDAKLKRIRNNRISQCEDGIIQDANTEISNNIIQKNNIGIFSAFGDKSFIFNNTFTDNYEAIHMWVSGGPTIIRNIIADNSFEAISGDFTDSLFVENNLITNVLNSFPIYLVKFSGQPETAPIKNNTISGNLSHAAISINSFSNEITNNIATKSFCAIRTYKYEGYDCTPQVSYNDFWDNVQYYSIENGAGIDTSLDGNIYLDPMFVGNSDYHLQYSSPCVDAGDPSIKDPDSSRSDIGCYGGPWGETYTYQDYPPRAPDSLKAKSLNDMILLSWKPNTESDLSHYVVYKSTSAGFIPDSSNMVGDVPKDSTVFGDHDFVMGNTYYYHVSAWDLTGHESEYSDELAVQATDVGEYTEEENGPPVFQLFQNYPNPFNSSTVIWYYLPDVGYQPAEVEITIYNLLGKVVRTLVKTRQYPGQHKVLWDGKDDSGKEVASGIYFYRLKVSGLTLVKPRKMVLLR
jgi:parallel beta-helix repeat protein